MGVNRAGYGIVDDDTVREAARQEIIRRYFRYQCEYAMVCAERETVQRAELIMNEIGAKPEDRPWSFPRGRPPPRPNAPQGQRRHFCGAAIELRDGSIVTGKNTPLMHAASSLV